jgi:hypothetical protein
LFLFQTTAIGLSWEEFFRPFDLFLTAAQGDRDKEKWLKKLKAPRGSGVVLSRGLASI